jgi:hypothetical protein
MFDTEGYDPRLSSDICKYESIVWTNQKSILSVISMFAAAIFSEIIIHSKGEVVELTVMMAENTCVELTAKE